VREVDDSEMIGQHQTAERLPHVERYFPTFDLACFCDVGMKTEIVRRADVLQVLEGTRVRIGSTGGESIEILMEEQLAEIDFDGLRGSVQLWMCAQAGRRRVHLV